MTDVVGWWDVGRPTVLLLQTMTSVHRTLSDNTRNGSSTLDVIWVSRLVLLISPTTTRHQLNIPYPPNECTLTVYSVYLYYSDWLRFARVIISVTQMGSCYPASLSSASVPHTVYVLLTFSLATVSDIVAWCDVWYCAVSRCYLIVCIMYASKYVLMMWLYVDIVVNVMQSKIHEGGYICRHLQHSFLL